LDSVLGGTSSNPTRTLPLFFQSLIWTGVVPYTTRGDSILAEPGGQWPGQVTSDFEDAMFDVTPDGKHAIAIIDSNSQKPETHVRLILNFADEVRRRLPNGAK